MISNLLAALVLLQDPDRSTPEKALQSFHVFWRSAQEDTSFAETIDAVDALGDFCRTEEYKKRRANKQQERKALREQYKTLASKLEITKVTDGADGSVTVDAIEHQRVRRPDPEAQKPVEADEDSLRRAVLEKSGDVWLVRELYRGCYMCKGTGRCSACEGKGKIDEANCWSCEGAKSCSACKGEKYMRDTPDEFTPDLAIADPEPAFSKDLSTPKAAAQSLADVAARRALLMTKHLREFVDRMMPRIRLFFAASVVKKMNDIFRKAEESGRKAFTACRPRVGSVEEKGEVAYAVVLDGEPGEKERKERFVLKKVGGNWLVDAAQHPCWGCAGSGTCGVCKGSGQNEGGKCYGCDGEKSCGSCKRAGWIDQDAKP